MAELNEVVNNVTEVVKEAAPAVTEAAKEIVVKVPNVMLERLKGGVAGAAGMWLAICGIPKAAKAIKNRILKHDSAAIDATGEFVEDNQEEDFNEVNDEPEQEESEK